MLIDSDRKDADSFDGDEPMDKDDDYYYDSSLDTGDAMMVDGDAPPSIPDGARLQFVNICRAEVGKDEDDKPFSVFFLEVHCKTASPSSWIVYRRYTQFRILNDLLRSEGYYVPVLPPKKLIGAFNADFVRQRKVCVLHSKLHCDL
jgi:hypothetical protein